MENDNFRKTDSKISEGFIRIHTCFPGEEVCKMVRFARAPAY